MTNFIKQNQQILRPVQHLVAEDIAAIVSIRRQIEPKRCSCPQATGASDTTIVISAIHIYQMISQSTGRFVSSP